MQTTNLLCPKHFKHLTLFSPRGKDVPKLLASSMANRRLNDRILELCEQATLTPEGSELNQIFCALHAALSEHNSRLRNTALSPVPNRRKPNQSEGKTPPSHARRWVL